MDRPDIKPLNPIWPVRPADKPGSRRKPVDERPRETPRRKRDKPGRDGPRGGRLDEYA